MNLHAFVLADAEHEVWLAREGAGYRLHCDGFSMGAALGRVAGAHGHARTLVTAAGAEAVTVAVDGDTVHVHIGGYAYELTHLHILERLAHAAHAGADDAVQAPMPGTLVALHVTAGMRVARGDALLVMESMKLETTITAPRDGTVQKVHVEQGRSFERGALLVTLDAPGESA